MFGRTKKKWNISERDPTYKVKYLGNVQTALMKGDGCVDKPTDVLWKNYLKTNNTVDMKLTVCGSGLKAHTKEQGLTEYWAHRISYCISHPRYPRLFVWVYRHEGKKMKIELRCHAVLCKSDDKAKTMAVQLHEKLSFALAEFLREKTRRQNTRLTLLRTKSLPAKSTGISGVSGKHKFLSQGQKFKPPADRSLSAPKLGSITEDSEGEDMTEIEEEEAANGRLDDTKSAEIETKNGTYSEGHNGTENAFEGELTNGLYHLEIGNDIDELKLQTGVQFQLTRDDDSDDDSSESGFSEQDTRESNSASSANSATTTTENGVVGNGVHFIAPDTGSPDEIDLDNCLPCTSADHRVATTTDVEESRTLSLKL